MSEPRYEKQRLENGVWAPTGQTWTEDEPMATTITPGMTRIIDLREEEP